MLLNAQVYSPLRSCSLLPSVGGDVGKLELPFITGGNVIGMATLKNSLVSFFLFFFFILSQFRRQESEIRVSVGLALKEDPLHPLLPVSGGYGQFLTFFSYGCITPVSPLVFTWPCSLCLCVSFSQFGSFLKFKHKFIIRPSNYTSTHHPNEMKTQVNTETCLQMLIIASVIITPDWNIQIAIGW